MPVKGFMILVIAWYKKSAPWLKRAFSIIEMNLLIPEAVSVISDELVSYRAADILGIDKFGLSVSLEAHCHHTQFVALSESCKS